MRGAIPPLPQYIFMAWCLVKQRDNFTFTFILPTLIVVGDFYCGVSFNTESPLHEVQITRYQFPQGFRRRGCGIFEVKGKNVVPHKSYFSIWLAIELVYNMCSASHICSHTGKMKLLVYFGTIALIRFSMVLRSIVILTHNCIISVGPKAQFVQYIIA
jgi:hypothetical protein